MEERRLQKVLIRYIVNDSSEVHDVSDRRL